MLNVLMFRLRRQKIERNTTSRAQDVEETAREIDALRAEVDRLEKLRRQIDASARRWVLGIYRRRRLRLWRPGRPVRAGVKTRSA